MKGIVQLNNRNAGRDFFEIGRKRQLELFLSNDDTESSSKADHDDDYYYYCDEAEDEDDYMEDVLKVNTVICIN